MAACAYFDLNPIRAGITGNVTTSEHPGIAKPAEELAKNSSLAAQAMRPLAGIISANFPQISSAEYIELVDWTRRQLHPGKRGKIAAGEPPALRKLGLDSAHWNMKVEGIGSGYRRGVGTAEELMQKAKAMGRASIGFRYGLGAFDSVESRAGRDDSTPLASGRVGFL